MRFCASSAVLLADATAACLDSVVGGGTRMLIVVGASCVGPCGIRECGEFAMADMTCFTCCMFVLVGMHFDNDSNLGRENQDVKGTGGFIRAGGVLYHPLISTKLGI